jgi:2-polyprenyl-3-methyl-5-hydroxy-6-metoxy-1,4-benzoquinol methylase
MSRFTERSAMTELIDAPGISFTDWAVCLRELNTINTWLGGHAITLEGVKKLDGAADSSFTIAEIGCGGGDNLKAIHRQNKKRNIHIKFIGIDINKACTDFAKKNCCELTEATFIASDYKKVFFNDHKPDIIFNSLFCHHFTNEQLVEMLMWMKENSRKGFFINDLQRHPLAYYSIKWLTQAFSGSYLVKHDAPVSVMRGFRKKEWETLMALAGIKNYTIKWKWAFRYLIIVSNE